MGRGPKTDGSREAGRRPENAGRPGEPRFVAVFAGLMGIYFLLTLTLEFRDSAQAARHPVVAGLMAVNQAVRCHLIAPYQQTIATATAATVNLLGQRTAAVGREVRGRGFAVEITGGCDGLELTLLLAAAILAFPAGAGRKLIGLAVGGAVIAGMNYVRVVSLWLIGAHWPAAFDVAHFTVWPFLLLGATLAVFVAWLWYASLAPAPPAGPGPRGQAGRNLGGPARWYSRS